MFYLKTTLKLFVYALVVELFDLYAPVVAKYRINCNAMKVVFIE